MKGNVSASEEPQEWRMPYFDDSQWNTGVSPFFYGEQLSGTVLVDMLGGYTSLYLRKSFRVANLENIKSVELRILSDDGCIVWINGIEVLRFNMPAGEIPNDGVALPPLPEPIPWQSKIFRDFKEFINDGDNVIAIHAFNSSLSNSSDFVIDCELIIHEKDLAPYVIKMLPVENSLVDRMHIVEIWFNEDVSGVDASDLTANGVQAYCFLELEPSHYMFGFCHTNEGKIEMKWSENHGIRDSDGNLLRAIPWNYYLKTNFKAGVIISEVMADNKTTLRDEDGDYSDWIEIANLKNEPVDLTGWGLTDNRENPFKWQFPPVILQPGEFLVVFASSKNRTNTGSNLHLNFSLSKSGEFLGLFNIYSGYVDEIILPPQITDISYGKMVENPEICGFFEKPTPGKANGIARSGFTPEPIFSVTSCVFNEPFYLQIFHGSTNSVIYYTLDGTTPCVGSLIYSEPILITPDNFTIVKAYAVEPDNIPSKVVSAVYVPVTDEFLYYTSSLPAVVISKMDNYPFSYDEFQQAYTMIFDSGETVYPRGTNSIAPFFSNTKVKIRGTTSTNQPKSNYSIEWIDEEGNERKIETLGMPADSEWVLYAPNNYDTPFIHNAFMYELSNRIGRYAPRYRFVELFIHEQNQGLTWSSYQGIYLLVEKIKRGQNRVNIEKLEPEYKTEPNISGGYIFKKDWLDREESAFTAGNQTLIYVYPDGREMIKPERECQRQYLKQYIDEFYNVLYSDNFTNPMTGYATYIDIDSWIDFHLLNTLAFNVDALSLSTYFYKPRNGKIYCGPIWDFDRSMDSRDDPRDDNPCTWWTYVENLGHNYFGFTGEPWWSRLFQDPDFWQKYIDRYQYLRSTEFSISNLWYLVDALSAQVREAQPREYMKWGEYTAPRNNSYDYEIQHMKEWLSNRVVFLDSNFLPAPVVSSESRIVPAGFTFEVTIPQDCEVYYTTDGSDPRLPGGFINPAAKILKNNVFVVGKNTKFTARSYNSYKYADIIKSILRIPSPWSSMVAVEFVVIPGTVTTNDTDGDSLPDWWECYYGLDYLNPEGEDGAAGDPDYDGISNIDEYLTNTDPMNYGDPLRLNIIIEENMDVLLRFNAVRFKSYEIESALELQPLGWMRVYEHQPIMLNTSIVVNLGKATNRVMFYRVISK